VTVARSRWLLVAAILLLLIAGGVLWRYTPLSDWATPSRLAQWIGTFKDAAWSPFAVVGLYVIGGLILFPLLLMIVATAVVFDPLVAIGLSLVGSLASASVTYFIGAKVARGTVKQAFGQASKRVSEALENRGLLAIAAVRTVPVAPFTIVNLAAGTLGVRYTDYFIGTALGLLPGITMITAFGNQLHEMWQNPTPGKIAVFIAIVVGWLALSFWLQKLTAKKKIRPAPQ
jgi:uncharacterized membrane protein YdjX (TVP38/TMEM64 family)